jgi:hypothetical protein
MEVSPYRRMRQTPQPPVENNTTTPKIAQGRRIEIKGHSRAKA